MASEEYSNCLEFAPEWDDEPFTMVPTVWARSGLHWEDMGFLFWLRTHRKGFRFTEVFMVGATPGGRDKVRSILRRLEKSGLIKRRKDRGVDGRITGTTFIVQFPTLQTSGLRTENPSVDADQGKQGGSAGEPYDGFTGDGKPVRGLQPAETPDPAAPPSTENPSVDVDQGKRSGSAGEPYDGFTGDGQTGDGKSATKKEQLKETSRGKELLPAAAEPPAPPRGSEPDGSGSSGTPEDARRSAAVALLRSVVDPVAARRLTERETTRLIDRVGRLIESGTSPFNLRAQLEGVTSATTTHPFSRLSSRLDEIATGGQDHPLAPAAAPSDPTVPPGVRVLPDGSRQLLYRSCGKRDCTDGGNAPGSGGGTWRRRINSDTGDTRQLCDHPVTTADGVRTTCHPDAARVHA